MIDLFPHQIKALNDTETHENVAYYLDMGLGKTYIGAEKMVRFGNKINLLICQKSKINDWINHFKIHYDAEIYDLTNKSEMMCFMSCAANGVLTPNASMVFGVINYELAWRRKELLELKNFSLMLDESSLIQNSKAKQTKFIMKLNPNNVILLSGTPTSGKYENLWTQLKLLGYDISEKTYLSLYVNFKKIKIGGMIHKIIDVSNPYKNVERLKSKMIQNGAIFMKTDECFELPEQNFITIHIPKSKDYVKFMKNDYVMLKNNVELIGDTGLTKRLRARQLCSQYSESKLQAFKDLVNSTKDRLIVFYNFNEELEKMIAAIDDENRTIAVVNGELKQVNDFEKYDDCVLFVQYQAGAMGLNLQRANKIIYFSLPERSELFEQSKKRIHRIGQQNKCFYYVMMMEKSIEEKIYDCLKQRKDYTDELFRKEFE